MSNEKFGVLQGDEVVQMLVTIWLDGFLSGGASCLEAVGATELDARRISEQSIGMLLADPLAMLSIETEVKERLTGRYTGDKSITVRTPK